MGYKTTKLVEFVYSDDRIDKVIIEEETGVDVSLDTMERLYYAQWLREDMKDEYGFIDYISSNYEYEVISTEDFSTHTTHYSKQTVLYRIDLDGMSYHIYIYTIYDNDDIYDYKIETIYRVTKQLKEISQAEFFNLIRKNINKLNNLSNE